MASPFSCSGTERCARRYCDVPVRVLRSGKKRWIRGHAIWVSDVFAWRASPAAWNEGLEHVTDASLHEHVDAQTANKLDRLGDSPVVASLTLVGGDVIDVAARPEHRSALMGPFAKQPGDPDPSVLSAARSDQ